MKKMNPDNTVLLKEGEYTLIKWTPTNPAAYYPLQSYINHQCGSGGWCWWDPRYIDEHCAECGGSPPEGIMGAWKLHNFDWIQQET